MNIRKLITVLTGVLISISLLSQENPGVTLLRLNELDLAKQQFMIQMRQQPADAHYYLGEVAWEQGNFAEALKEYTSAMTSNPESLYSQVGAAKGALHNEANKESKQAKEVRKILENIYKKNKKDIPLLLEVAKAFYDNGMISDGDKATSEARKADKTNPFIYIMEGNRMLKQNKAGDAAMQFDQAINFDNKNVLALIKSGKVYENINAKIAIDQFQKAMEIEPSNKLVNRYLAKVYSVSGRYAASIDIYDEYFKAGNYNLEDIRYYSNALYFNRDFEKAEVILKEGVKREGDNFVFNRLLMYTQNELKKYDEALTVAENFFKIRTQVDGGYLDKDFVSYGQILAENGRPEDALKAYEKAIELNPDNVELFRELAASMATDKMHIDAARYMDTYIKTIGEDVASEQDYFSLGRYYQFAAQAMMKDSIPEKVEERNELYRKADAAYEVLTEKNPTSYLGYYMRASVNSGLDPEIKQGLAKPYYEKTLEVIQENDEMEQRQVNVLTAYEYLAVYYLYKFEDTSSAEDKTKSLEYCNMYLDLNTDRASINQIKEILTQ